MGVTPLTFTGTSSFAPDFQNILNRAVAIANLPLQQLENTDTTTLSKKTQLGSVESAASSLTSALTSLGTVASSQALSASSSNSSAATMLATGAKAPGNYTIDSITSLATSASETSLTGYLDSSNVPVSASGTMNLVIGSQTYQIQLTAQNNNLVGLQNAIAALHVGVNASILTTGNGNYLSLTATSLGETTLQLFEGTPSSGTNILTAANQGTDAVFSLNGLPIVRTQNTINDLISGATITLKAPTSTPVSLTLQSDATQLGNAVQTLVSAYNGAVEQVNSQTGKNAGVLVGDPVILQLESTLRQLTSYQGSGSIKSLADIGVTLAADGTMSFDQTVLSALSNTQLAGAFQFLGTAKSGFAGLSQNMSEISDPISGLIAVEQTALSGTDSRLQGQITDTAASINSMQQTLLAQLSIADTLISTLTSQQNALTASIQSLNYVAYGKLTT